MRYFMLILIVLSFNVDANSGTTPSSPAPGAYQPYLPPDMMTIKEINKLNKINNLSIPNQPGDPNYIYNNTNSGHYTNWGESARATSSFILSAFFLFTTNAHKIVVNAQDDAAIYIASGGEIYSAYLEQAFMMLRKEYPDASTMELAQAIMAITLNP